MKQFIILIFLMLNTIACSGVNSDNGSCTQANEICIKIRAAEPVIHGEPINLVITATSTEDIPDLGISLIYWPITMIIGEAQGQEPGIEVWRGNSGVDWKVNIRADEPVIYHRQLILPRDAGVYTITVHASTPQVRVIDEITLYQTDNNLMVILPGTVIPITTGPLPTTDLMMLQTLQAMPTRTLFPTLTPRPATITPPAYPPPTTPPMEGPSFPYP